MKTKLLICMLTTVLAVLCLFGCSDKTNDEKKLLSSMTDEELIDFLEENDFVLPEGYGEPLDECINIVHFFVTEIEENPNVVSSYGLPWYGDVINALKPIVNGYYGITDYQ